MWTVFLIVSGVGVNTAFKSLLCGSEVWIYIWRTQWFICCFFNVCFSRATFFYFLRWHIVLLSHGNSGNVIGCFLVWGQDWVTYMWTWALEGKRWKIWLVHHADYEQLQCVRKCILRETESVCASVFPCIFLSVHLWIFFFFGFSVFQGRKKINKSK